MNFCAAILILKMKEDMQHFLYIMLYISRKLTQVKLNTKRFVQYMKKLLWLIQDVKSGLWTFLVLLIFWPNNSLLWGCLMHWKVFSSTPGLSPLEANGRREPTSSKHPNQSYWWKWKVCLLFYGKNITGFLANPILFFLGSQWYSVSIYHRLLIHHLLKRWSGWCPNFGS